MESTLKKSGRKKSSAQAVLTDIAKAFFDFYSPYGEYFDMLLYSYKGLKQVQIQGSTLTRLMSVTLGSLDKLKTFIVESAEFRAKNEDEALQVVFLLWGILLGCHKFLTVLDEAIFLLLVEKISSPK
ncbi:hypothetical protein EBQ74_10440 [bacterium]|nr:hypothetical protein [bacterium]